MQYILIVLLFFSTIAAAQNKVTLNLPGGNGAAGGVSVVSVVDANGFEGTVANPSTTPAITIKTNQTGLLYGNGTSMIGTKIGYDLVKTNDTVNFANVANVMSFGAVADGTTDNTPAFQAAANTGLTVFVPHGSGTFLVSTTITLGTNQLIFAYDWGAVIQIIANTRAVAVGNGSRVSGIQFLGNGKAGSGAFNTGVFCNLAIGWSIDNCLFKDFSGDPVANGGGGIFGSSISSNNSDGGRISNCYFDNNDAGLNLATRAEYVTVSGSTFGSNTVAILAAAGNLTINNNIIQENTTGIKAISVTNGAHSTISNNLLNHNTYPIWLEDATFGLGFDFNDNMVYFGAIYIKDCANIKFIGGHYSQLDSVHLNNATFISRTGGWWGFKTGTTHIPINKYNGSDDFEILGETRYDATTKNYWIKQVHDDTVSFTGPAYFTKATFSNTVTGIPVSYVIAASDETTDLTTGTAKVTFRMPHAMTVTNVRASVNTASSSGLPTIDINENGTTILSTKITIDASEKTSTTAATAPVISDASLADDAEITIDIDVSGTGAKGLKIIITGTR